MQGIDKLLAPLDGVPVLRRTVEALASAPEITELIVVTRADRLEAVQTIKRAESGLVLETPDRCTLVAVQTPQVFRTEEIRSVLRWAIAQGLPLTDDCSAMEAAGRPVRLTPGDVENLKITTPVDLRIAEAIWKGRTT